MRFHGRLAKPELQQLVRGSVASVVPSRWHENQPLTILESFGAAVPVIATDLGGLPELVRDGVDGLVVAHEQPAALAAAMDALYADPDRALRDGCGGAGPGAGRILDAGPPRAARRGVRRGDRAPPERRMSGAGAARRRVKVLYFAGSGRSGTTIINNIIGQLDGAFAAGELRFLWDRGVVENRLCGCGRPFHDCPTWTTVMKTAFPGGARTAWAARHRTRTRSPGG